MWLQCSLARSVRVVAQPHVRPTPGLHLTLRFDDVFVLVNR